MNIFIDIETIPTQNEEFKKQIMESVSAPGNYSKPESIKKWMDENAEQAGEDQWRKTALDGAFGEVICASWAIDGGLVQSVYRDLEGSEAELLIDLFSQIKHQTDIKREAMVVNANLKWIGHYITGFDLRFLWQRSVINNVEPAIKIPYAAKPWDDNVFDTLVEWKGSGSGVGKLGSICEALGFEGKGDIDGSQVWDYVKEGRVKDIVVKYCEADVYKARNLYKAMTFQRR